MEKDDEQVKAFRKFIENRYRDLFIKCIHETEYATFLMKIL
jgi:hypothetical protein